MRACNVISFFDILAKDSSTLAMLQGKIINKPHFQLPLNDNRSTLCGIYMHKTLEKPTTLGNCAGRSTTETNAVAAAEEVSNVRTFLLHCPTIFMLKMKNECISSCREKKKPKPASWMINNKESTQTQDLDARQATSTHSFVRSFVPRKREILLFFPPHFGGKLPVIIFIMLIINES